MHCHETRVGNEWAEDTRGLGRVMQCHASFVHAAGVLSEQHSQV